MRKEVSGSLIALAIITFVAGSGCASKNYVLATVEESEARTTKTTDILQSQIERDQTKLAEHEEQMESISATAGDALERAIAAGKLAEGKFLFETILSDDKIRFGFDKTELAEEGVEALATFAADLKSQNEDVFIEIQGHTDSTGSDAYNLTLGEKRAETVRRYLSKEHGIALHRMSVISYGESSPIADNETREGRETNRRVGLVVLK
ncbi:MAG: OmpA family protein [bacterium]|nr:OmpA family protein [bacterium]